MSLGLYVVAVAWAVVSPPQALPPKNLQLALSSVVSQLLVYSLAVLVLPVAVLSSSGPDDYHAHVETQRYNSAALYSSA